MSWQDRIIAAMLLVYGLANGALLAYMASVVPLPAGFLAASAALAGAGIVAGLGSLRGLRWARLLGALFFLVQVAHAALPTLGASVVLGLHFTVSVTGAQGEPVGVDPIAVTLLAWSLLRLALARAQQPAGPEPPEPLPPQARRKRRVRHQKRNTPETPSRLE